jgi:hypothetical protein
VDLAHDQRPNRKRIYLPSTIACLVIVGVLSYLVTSQHAPSQRQLSRHGSHAPADTTAIEAAASQAIATARVDGSPIDSGFPVLSNPSSRFHVPMTTDGGETEGPGTFMLAFVCAGNGKVEATLSVGESATHMSAACSLQPTPMRVHLSARQAGQVFVQFAAQERETVAIAYELACNNYS